MSINTKSRTALVTGASSGIGRATARALAESGFNVAVNARRKEKLDTLVAEIEGAGGVARAFPADAADTASLDALWSDVAAWCGTTPTVLVANAGRGLQGGVLSSEREPWEEMFQLNVVGTLHLMRCAANAMKDAGEGPRDIVVLGSVVGSHISPFSGVYGATKFAIEAAAEALRREVGRAGVRVTTIKPGVVASEFQEVAGYDEANFGAMVAKFGDMLEPEDVARSIRFVVEQPANVHVNQIIIRPVGQDYP
jgi:NADP-dependent 3-hydroxy acid dehydrogenase YdfG